MKREDRRDMSVSCRGMVCAMSSRDVINSAARFNVALRFYFFGFWFTRIPIRES